MYQDALCSITCPKYSLVVLFCRIASLIILKDYLVGKSAPVDLNWKVMEQRPETCLIDVSNYSL